MSCHYKIKIIEKRKANYSFAKLKLSRTKCDSVIEDFFFCVLLFQFFCCCCFGFIMRLYFKLVYILYIQYINITCKCVTVVNLKFD